MTRKKNMDGLTLETLSSIKEKGKKERKKQFASAGKQRGKHE